MRKVKLCVSEDSFDVPALCFAIREVSVPDTVDSSIEVAVQFAATGVLGQTFMIQRKNPNGRNPVITPILGCLRDGADKVLHVLVGFTEATNHTRNWTSRHHHESLRLEHMKLCFTFFV
jgi:hypothetical protein